MEPSCKVRLISTRVVIDIATMGVIEKDSYEYTGSVAECAGVVGMGLSNPSITLVNTMNAISEKYVIPTLGDVAFTPSPVFWFFTKDGKKMGRGEIVYPEVTQEEMTGGAYYGDQLLDTQVIDSIVPANQLWRFYRQSLAIPITDIILNRGGTLSILKAKTEIASASFLQKLCRALWDTSPQNTTLDVDSIPDWIKLTTNVIAGIDRNAAANAFWRPQANVALGGTILPGQLEDGYASTVWGYDEPDILTLRPTTYAKFKANYLPVTPNAANPGVMRVTQAEADGKAIQGSFKVGFYFNNAAVVPDRFVPSTEVYLWNTKYMYPVFHEGDYFTMDAWTKPSNQRVIVSTIYLTWQLINRAPRMAVTFTGAPA